MRLPLWRVAEFTGATGAFDRESVAAGYSIDSRTIAPGQLFFAVKGERLDGHDFVESALQRGAVAAVISRHQAERFRGHPIRLLEVDADDALPALHALAMAVRKLWGRPLVGVTGSAGKTTTKEAIAYLIAKRRRVMKSEGNLNNQFGMPLQLLKLEPEHEVAVVEMGMNHAGEIAALAQLAGPTMGVVTCVAPVHLEFFDSVAAIARAKYELIQALPSGGTAILNADDPYVSQFGRDFRGKVIYFGTAQHAEVRAESIQPREEGGFRFDLVVGGERVTARLPLLGRHNVMNALAAVAAAAEFGLTPAEAAAALAELTPEEKRGQVLRMAGATIVNDCYNSNPAALKSMLDALASIPARRRIAVAGEMLELGPAGEELHRECGEYMAGRVDLLIAVRGLARSLQEGAAAAGVQARFVESPEEAGAILAAELQEGDAVLLKASRGVRLERALEALGKRLKAEV